MIDKVAGAGFGTQIRRSPFFTATEKCGCQGYSVYNHMYIPRSFGDPEQNFWNLVNDAILCDVSVERQVEITGADAAKFVQYLTPRNLSDCQPGQCKYILMTNQNGGIVNDPVLLKLAENHYWLSLADSDALLWAMGVQVHSGMDVCLREPDVSPLQLQGPKSREIMVALFGDWVADLKYYWFKEVELDGIPLLVSRTGWSSELGYEIFLRDGSRGSELWEKIMNVGQPLGLHVGHTSSIRRIEGGMLSYVADATIENNPFELGLDRLVDLDMPINFIGKDALRKIQRDGVSRYQVGLEISGAPLENPNNDRWGLQHHNQQQHNHHNNKNDGKQIGEITSAIYSPRLKKNIALAFVQADFASVGEVCLATLPDGQRPAQIVDKPFFDPRKQVAAAT